MQQKSKKYAVLYYQYAKNMQNNSFFKFTNYKVLSINLYDLNIWLGIKHFKNELKYHTIVKTYIV